MSGGQGVGVGIAMDVGLEQFGAPRKSKMLVFRLSCALWRAWHLGAARKHRIHVLCKEREYGVSGSSLSDTATGAALEKESTFSEKKRQRHQLAALKADLPQMFAPMPPPKFPEEGLTQRGRRERLRWNNAKRRCPRKEAVKKRSTTGFLSECFS